VLNKGLPGLEIRKFRPQYRDCLEEILLSNVPLYFAVHEVDEWKTFLNEHADSYFVLLHREGVIGAGGYFFPNNKTARLSWDFLLPEYQGKGFGKFLLQYRLKRVMMYGEVICIEVWTSQHAFRFYEKAGFVVREITENYWDKGLHLYLMEKRV